MIARRLCSVERYLVAAIAYLKGTWPPKHPMGLSSMPASATPIVTPDSWRFTHKNGETAIVHPASGPLRVNNGDAMVPGLVEGLGLGVLPDFIIREQLADGRLERVLPDWSLPVSGLHWVTPPGGPKPARVEVLAEYLAKKLGRSDRTAAGKGRRDQRK